LSQHSSQCRRLARNKSCNEYIKKLFIFGDSNTSNNGHNSYARLKCAD
jgi:hypothetical protein